MELSKIEFSEKTAHLVSKWFNRAAGVGLVVMLALTTADVIAVKVFSRPIPGAIEWVSFLAVVVTGFALAHTQVLHGHIQVEFFVSRLPARWQGGVGAIVALLGIVLFVILSWRSFEFGMDLQASGEVSMTQHIPFYPFVYALAVCCLPVCLVLLAEFLDALDKMVNKK